MSKVVVVTGAARGIGLATAKKFLSEGWRVALLDIDGKTQDLARNNLNEPGNTLAIECDVSDPDQVANAIKEVVAKFSHIDALVNNAGIAVFKPVMQTSFEEWSRGLAVNLNGPFICTQACVPAMLARGGGSIV
ncbi:MAG: SDR family NAD(P)-dependent oxidoreductase, partial [Proteobacteria bacterium]|nr:SDR family NAD(P)-dependent oxidoreductase [Pseudomonadota bacterium]